MTDGDPHAGQPVLHAGVALADARIAVVLVHGRGASAEDMLGLASTLALDATAYLAPQAAGRTWYPHSFLAPLESNQPGIASGLGRLADLVQDLAGRQIEPARVALLGFSQGACLALEFAARHARRYKAVIGLSGGLIGPPGTPRDYTGSLAATPVFLGCSDNDPHIPLARVHETAQVFTGLGAAVDERIYPAMGHTINRDELDAIRALLREEPGAGDHAAIRSR